jgi:hypothetical protein
VRFTQHCRLWDHEFRHIYSINSTSIAD